MDGLGQDRRGAVQPPKRTRRDYGEYEQQVPADRVGMYAAAQARGRGPAEMAAAYGPRGGELDYEPVPRASIQGRWRDDGMGHPADMLAYGPGPEMGLGGPARRMSLEGAGMGMGMMGPRGIVEDGLIPTPGREPALNMRSMGMEMGGRVAPLNGLGMEQERGLGAMRGAIGVEPLPDNACSTLYVDGIPIDCSKREAAHIFRPFIGFQGLRLVHKESKKQGGGEKIVLCFVEFTNIQCAATALEALQGYKFDESDPESYVLRVSFAKHPGPRSAAERRRGGPDGYDNSRGNAR
eukprot:TRINITY_DN731_c0_g1_i5.p1 TRINITY_DN731_c0_g1~~TRINITY_DN731_c0_g1_i5.p1  ORF type:complete len:294 (-),score=59.57 TRINITY_DN731_c0_g1_i5:693-1574(-)